MVLIETHFVPLVPLITIDDDLMGARSADNEVKMLSHREADREGQSGNVIADTLFGLSFDTRTRKRGEAQ